MLRHQRSRASCVSEPDHETDPGGCRNPYKYRFFTLQRESALAPGVFASSDAPSPFGSSFWKLPRLFASVALSGSQARPRLARFPPEAFARERAWRSETAFHVRRNSIGEGEADPQDVCVVCTQYASRAMRPQAPCAAPAPRAAPPLGTPH